MKILNILCLSALLCLTLMSNAQDNRQLRQAAEKGLKDMQALITEDNYQLFKLSSPTALSSATLGEPIQEYHIGLDALKEFNGSAEELDKLMKGGNVLVPVISNGRANRLLTGIELSNSQGEWQAHALGSATPLEEYEKVKKSNKLDDKAFLVRIPALNQYFIARGEGEQLELASFGVTVADLPDGRFIPAIEALKQLQPIAQKHNGMPW
jgi:hypothetical protein